MSGSTKIWLGVGVFVLAGAGPILPATGDAATGFSLVGAAAADDVPFCAKPENAQKPEYVAAGGEGGEGGEGAEGGEEGEGGEGGEEGEGGEGGETG